MGLYLVVVVNVAACLLGHGGLLDRSVSRGLLGHCVPDNGLPSFFGVLSPFLLGPSIGLARGWSWQREKGVCREIQRTGGHFLYTLSLRGCSWWRDM